MIYWDEKRLKATIKKEQQTKYKSCQINLLKPSAIFYYHFGNRGKKPKKSILQTKLSKHEMKKNFELFIFLLGLSVKSFILLTIWMCFMCLSFLCRLTQHCLSSFLFYYFIFRWANVGNYDATWNMNMQYYSMERDRLWFCIFLFAFWSFFNHNFHFNLLRKYLNFLGIWWVSFECVNNMNLLDEIEC